MFHRTKKSTTSKCQNNFLKLKKFQNVLKVCCLFLVQWVKKDDNLLKFIIKIHLNCSRDCKLTIYDSNNMDFNEINLDHEKVVRFYGRPHNKIF